MDYRNRQEGFTLLEVLAAVTLLLIGILAAASMQISSLGGNTLAIRITEATARGSDRIEQLAALAYDDPLLDETSTTFAGLGTITADTRRAADDGSGFRVLWNVVEDFPINDCKTVRVLVTRSDRGTAKIAAMDYMKMRN